MALACRSVAVCALVVCGLCASVHHTVAFGGQFTPDASATDASITVSGDALWVVNLTAESDAVRMAVKDVQEDWYKVLGYAAVTVDSPPSPGQYDASLPVVYVGTVAAQPWLSRFNLSGAGCTAGTEAHCLLVTHDAAVQGAAAGSMAVVATGNDMRGAIFGLYALAEEVLGVDPWYMWTDHEPAYVGQVQVPVGTTAFPVPAFEYRGWFTNDEDLNGYWKASPLGQTVFDLATFDRFFETLLRLKGNLFLVGTVPLPDENSIALASRRGLVVIQHHFNLLGMDTFRWPEELGKGGWDWRSDPQDMGYTWQACVAAQQDYEVAWSVGLRGLNDYSYPCSSIADCGAVISQAMGNQTQWVRQRQPDADIVTYLWDEGLKYLEAGVLDVPDGVDILFTDEGAGFVHGGPLLSKYAVGLYYHTAMLNGQANQLTEMVPPSRIFQELGMFVREARGTKFFIDNISDLRPVPLTTDAVTRFAYNPEPFMQDNPNATATSFMHEWASRQYDGSSVAAQVAELWGEYFQVPYIVDGMSDSHLGGAIASLSQLLTADLQAGTIQPSTVKQANQLYPVSLPIVTALLAKGKALLPDIPAARRDFYTGHTLLQQSIQAYGCSALASLCNAVVSAADGNNAGASGNLTAALGAMDDMFAAERAAEYGQWRGLYLYDRLVDFQRARTLLRQSAAALAKAPVPPARPSVYYTFYDYQLAVEQNYPYFFESSEWNLWQFVHISCSPCDNATNSGRFHPPSSGATGPLLTMSTLEAAYAHGAPVSIRYTTDGTDPVPESALFTQPVPLSVTRNTTVKARAFAGQVPLSVVPAAWFAAW